MIKNLKRIILLSLVLLLAASMLNSFVFCSISEEAYVNHAHGYSINPPSEWTLDESEAPNSVHFINPVTKMVIHVSAAIAHPDATLDQWVSVVKSDVTDDPNCNLVSEGSLNIGELSGYEVVFTETYPTEGLTTKNRVFLLVEQGRSYIVWFSALTTDYDDYLPHFEESLQTFKLVGSPLPPLDQLLGQIAQNSLPIGIIFLIIGPIVLVFRRYRIYIGLVALAFFLLIVWTLFGRYMSPILNNVLANPLGMESILFYVMIVPPILFVVGIFFSPRLLALIASIVGMIFVGIHFGLDIVNIMELSVVGGLIWFGINYVAIKLLTPKKEAFLTPTIPQTAEIVDQKSKLRTQISVRRKWKVNRSPNETLKIVTNKLAQKKAKLTEASSRRIEAIMGSRLRTRLIGGFFVSKSTLPVKITLSMNEVDGQTEIDATIQDNLGFGLRTGMVGKYKKHIQSLFDELANTIGGFAEKKEEAIKPAPPPPKAPQAIRTCPKCGVEVEEDELFCHSCGGVLTRGEIER